MMRHQRTIDGPPEGHLSGPVSVLIFSLFLKAVTFRYCSSAVNRFVVLSTFVVSMSNFLNSLKGHTVLRYVKFATNNCLEITLLVQKLYFMPVKLCYL